MQVDNFKTGGRHVIRLPAVNFVQIGRGDGDLPGTQSIQCPQHGGDDGCGLSFRGAFVEFAEDCVLTDDQAARCAGVADHIQRAIGQDVACGIGEQICLGCQGGIGDAVGNVYPCEVHTDPFGCEAIDIIFDGLFGGQQYIANFGAMVSALIKTNVSLVSCSGIHWYLFG